MMYKFVGVLFTLWNVQLVPLNTFQKGKTPSYPKEAIDYLERYGYLPEKTHLHTIQTLLNATKRFQEKMKLLTTGYIDQVTHNRMLTARCGEPDYSDKNARNNIIVNNGIITKTFFTYMVDQWSDLLPIRRQNLTIRNAFYYWRHSVSRSLHLHWNENNPDFILSFVNKTDKKASANGPYSITKIVQQGRSKRIYFHVNTTESVLILFKTARHMFGHIFGKSHWDSGTKMSPFLLKKDSHSFGKPVTKPLCNASIKSIHAQYNEGASYVFVGDDRNWKINSSLILNKGNKIECKHRIIEGYPNRFQSKWGKEIPDSSKLDEAFALPYGDDMPWDTIFFVGDTFYRYKSSDRMWDKKAGGKKISNWWHGIPDNVDAVFYFYDNGKYPMYFFKGDEVYKFRINILSNSYGNVELGYPKKIAIEFPGAPNNLDSAYRTYCSGKNLFFQGRYYWIWDGAQAQGPYDIGKLITDFCV